MTQPLGRRPSRFPGKTDWHIHDSDHHVIKNWWETGMCSVENKALENREVRKEIQEELDELN